MLIAIAAVALDGPPPPAGSAIGAPTFTLVACGNGEFAAQAPNGQFRSVDQLGGVSIKSCPDGPGDNEKFALVGGSSDPAISVYWPRHDLPGSPVYRYGATKVPGGG